MQEAVQLRLEDIDISEWTDHIDKLHKDSKGYITIASKIDKYKQWHYKKDEINESADKIIAYLNSYVSQNTFYKPQRRIENIKELRALYIDIDCYNSKYTKDAVKHILETELYGTKIPVPNLLIDSGRGLYYIVLIEPVPSKVLPLWYATQRYLFNQLEEFGADVKALDPTRILRIVGTINSKSNSVVEVLDSNEYVHTLREIQEEYLPEIDEAKKKKKGRPKKIVGLFNEYSLYHARVVDISRICELRNYDMRGKRELTLFLYRYYSCCFTNDVDEALERALELNEMFIEPLSTNEVITSTRSAQTAYMNKKYKYSNAKLIDVLEITDSEQMHLRTIISGKEKYRRSAEEQKEKKKANRRNENGLTKREQEKINKINKIKELKEQGLNQSEIAKELNITRQAVSKLVKEIYT